MCRKAPLFWEELQEGIRDAHGGEEILKKPPFLPAFSPLKHDRGNQIYVRAHCGNTRAFTTHGRTSPKAHLVMVLQVLRQVVPADKALVAQMAPVGNHTHSPYNNVETQAC